MANPGYLTIFNLNFNSLFQYNPGNEVGKWQEPWVRAIRDQRLHDHDQRKTRSRTRSRIAELNVPLSANHDRKKNFTISQEKLYNFS